MRTQRKVIEYIIRINPLLCGLQRKIEREQESVIADTVSPAHKAVEKLIELDNRRIDLCNLNVLHAFIERGLGAEFGVLRSCAFAGASSPLYAVAARQIELAGYDIARCDREFSYLFKLLKRNTVKKKAAIIGSDQLSIAYVD